MRVYLDAVFLLNLLVDFLLIMGTNRLTGFPPEPGKGFLAALVGGIYAALCLIPGLSFLGSIHWRVIFFCLMSLLAFGCDKSAWRRGAILLLLSMALGGIAAGAGAKDFGAVCICGVLLVFLCRVGFSSHGTGQSYLPVELGWNGRTVRVLALRDTGNTLRDPLTGEQVLVCGADVGEELLGIPEECFCDPVALLASEKVAGMRLIPYRAVGRPAGMMAAVRLKQVKIGGATRDPLVAFAPQRIGSGEGYRMLTGGML